jgi:hypothetical protein
LAFASFDKLLYGYDFQISALDLPNHLFNAKDAFYFNQEWRKDKFLQALSKNNLVVRLKSRRIGRSSVLKNAAAKHTVRRIK